MTRRSHATLPSTVPSTWTPVALAAALALAACGGGGGEAAAPAATTLSGTVAVGAPITGGTLRVVDATGAVVASDVAVGADGTYAGVALTGTGPWRIEACGHAGGEYTCVYSVAGSAGTANVTPLTTATTLLAAGAAPGATMSGAAPTLTAASVAAAQEQLKAALAPILASAGVAAGIDFTTAPLDAGARTGHDGLLDRVGVATGTDANPFVQITPKVGEGNAYLERGSSSGALSANAAAAALDLSGLERLFADMSASMASASACADAGTGFARSLATDARVSIGEQPAVGRAAVAAEFCGFFGSSEGGFGPLWGARFLSPTLGRCDLGGAAPVCGVSFALRFVDGSVQALGAGFGVTQEAGAWKFLGDVHPIAMRAAAKAQRDKRVDGTAPVVAYSRAIAFEIQAAPGIACAKVSQKDANGTAQTVAYYKRHPMAMQQQSLSLWTADGFSQAPSLDPMAGATRSGDDTWLALPQGAAGDATIRNFYRGGRSVTVDLYGDAACATPHLLAGRSAFAVEVDGVPPVWSRMGSLPWPEVDATGEAALRALALAAMANGSFTAAWTFPNGPLGVSEATVCGDRASCGQGGTGRLGEASFRPNARTATVALTNGGPALEARDAKMLSLHGRTGDGVDLQANTLSCPATTAGQAC